MSPTPGILTEACIAEFGKWHRWSTTEEWLNGTRRNMTPAPPGALVRELPNENGHGFARFAGKYTTFEYEPDPYCRGHGNRNVAVVTPDGELIGTRCSGIYWIACSRRR